MRRSSGKGSHHTPLIGRPPVRVCAPPATGTIAAATALGPCSRASSAAAPWTPAALTAGHRRTMWPQFARPRHCAPTSPVCPRRAHWRRPGRRRAAGGELSWRARLGSARLADVDWIERSGARACASTARSRIQCAASAPAPIRCAQVGAADGTRSGAARTAAAARIAAALCNARLVCAAGRRNAARDCTRAAQQVPVSTRTRNLCLSLRLVMQFARTHLDAADTQRADEQRGAATRA